MHCMILLKEDRTDPEVDDIDVVSNDESQHLATYNRRNSHMWMASIDYGLNEIQAGVHWFIYFSQYI